MAAKAAGKPEDLAHEDLEEPSEGGVPRAARAELEAAAKAAAHGQGKDKDVLKNVLGGCAEAKQNGGPALFEPLILYTGPLSGAAPADDQSSAAKDGDASAVDSNSNTKNPDAKKIQTTAGGAAAAAGAAAGAGAKERQTQPTQLPPVREGKDFLPLVVKGGHHGEQGVRMSMEDQDIVTIGVRLSECASKDLEGNFSLVGVFDGHGGEEAAKFAAEHLPKLLVARLEKAESHNDVGPALHYAFVQTDAMFLKRDVDTSGTTAVVCLIHHASGRLWCANAGDSRAVLCRGGVAIPLSRDHKADRPDEVKRVRAAGGFVIHKRVMGELAVSRAIGDSDFKDEDMVNLVIPDPEVKFAELDETDDFILLACDGLYDVMDNQAAMDLVREEAKKHGSDLDKVARAVVARALELKTRDNVSVVVVRLHDQDKQGK